jgi:cellulose synthase/poly-beta-1,6-N-acetylglucosamine synthase-like glycosyltransferase
MARAGDGVTIAQLLFWVPTIVLAWVYIGYPLVAAIVARLRPFRIRSTGTGPRRVTVGIAAYQEGPRLEARVTDALAQAVPFELEVVVASDGSTDGTVEIIGRMARDDARIRVLDLPRGGQTAAQDAIFAVATGDVVVLTDAETRFAPGCLAALVAPFEDARVGCTTGRLAWLDAGRTATSRNEGAYWRYEQAVRRVESEAGWLTAVTGALLAVRRSCFREVPAHASMDHLLPLHVRDQGLAVLAVHEAVASDRGIAGLRDQFRNRSRTATRGIRANLSMAGRLGPWRRPSAALAIWSHKILRWATPWLAMLAAVGATWLGAAGEPAYLVPVAIGLVVVALAAIGALVRSRRRRPPRITSLPLAVVVVNLAFLVGWLNVLRGRRIEAWHRTAWATTAAGSDVGRGDGRPTG